MGLFGDSYRVLLRITDEARLLVGLGKRIGHESLVHEYWKHRYARCYQQQGYDVTIEAPRPDHVGGAVDGRVSGKLTTARIGATDRHLNDCCPRQIKLLPCL